MASIPPAGPLPVSASEQRDAAELARELANADALLTVRQMPSVLLVGEFASGKSHSIRSLLRPGTGITRVVLLTMEPGYQDLFGDFPPEQLAWHYIPPSEGTFDQLIEMTRNVQNMSLDAMQSSGNWNKTKYPQFMQVLQLCNNFIDGRTGQSLGPVWNFGPETCFVIESITALTDVVENAAVGDMPFNELRHYQVIQKMIRRFLNHVVFSTKCLFVCTAHLERETEENTGMSRLMISTKGRKLAPILPRFFSEMILSTRVDATAGGASFKWQTQHPDIRLKTRNLAWSNSLPADFAPLLASFAAKQRKGGV